MGKDTQENQLSLIPSPELARSLAIISAYSRILEAQKDDFYTRLVSWGVSALRLDGRSGEWIKVLIARQPTLQQQWRAVRQFFPEDAIHALAKHLEAQMQDILERRS